MCLLNRGPSGNWNEPWYRQYWCHLWNQYGTPSIFVICAIKRGSRRLYMFFVSFQDYTATIFLRQRWRDARLMFPGNESVSVDGRLVSLLWIPDTFIPDSKRSFLHDVTVENRLIRIFSNGTVLYALRYISLPKLWRSLTADISRCWSQTRRKQIQSTAHCSHVLYKKERGKNN